MNVFRNIEGAFDKTTLPTIILSLSARKGPITVMDTEITLKLSNTN